MRRSNTTTRRKIKNEHISNIIDYQIKYIEDLEKSLRVMPINGKSGFSETEKLIILWYQQGDNVVRENFWRKEEVEIART